MATEKTAVKAAPKPKGPSKKELLRAIEAFPESGFDCKALERTSIKNIERILGLLKGIPV